MNPAPSLQTVATLTRGTSPVGQQAFVWGVQGRPFSVGTRGDWVVDAGGVEPVHFFLNFDGRMLHAASGPSGALATVGGVQLDHTWRPVHVFGEIAFGGAVIRITCEDAPQHASAPPPQQQASAPPPNPAPFENAPAPAAQPLDRTAYARPGPLKTQPLVLTPEQRAYAEAAAAPLPVRDSGAPQYGGGPSGQHPAAGASPSQPPQAIPTVHSSAPPGLNATRASAAPPGGAPNARVSAPAPGGAMPPGAPMPANRASAPAGTPPVIALAQDVDIAGTPTMSDAGALRALANQVQAEPISHVPAEAYLAYVQRAAGGHVAPPVGSGPMGANPARQGQSPSGAPGAFGSAPPRLTPSAAPPVQNQDAASADAEQKPEKEKTSWVMRIVLLLLPVAGYFAIFWEPPSPPAPAEGSSAATDATSTAIGSAAHPTASARIPASTSATPTGPASASASPAVPSATPSAVVAAPSASGPLSASSGAPVVAPMELSTTSADPPDRKAPKGEATASPTISSLPLSTKLARDALNAAFEGRLEEAAERYDKLSTGPDGEAYRVSARLIRARAIRKP